MPFDNPRILASALLEIDATLERAHGAKNQIEDDITLDDDYSTGGYEDPAEALGVILQEAKTRLSVLLDVMKLDATQSQLADQWKALEANPKGLGDTTFHHDVDWLESKPLEYLRNLVTSVRIFIEPSDSLRDAEQIKLEQLLRDTAVLVKKRNIVPKSEIEIQTVMHDYLGAYFPTYTSKVQVHGCLKNFKPDGGVSSLKAAIEFKFATKAAEVTTAFSGIFEDISGYSGSDDWKIFYAVVYQTEPFVSETRFRADLDRVAARHWHPILVNGKGQRNRRLKANLAKKSE